MEDTRLLEILRNEMQPALGCTEPVAVAYAASKAAELLSGKPEQVQVLASRNILKNAMGVGIPGTDAVGAEMARELNAAGIHTLHDTTLYDAPGYTSSYQRSRAGVQDYLARYPSIKIVLDVHRDAIEDSDGTRVKPVCEIDGESTAQVMVIAGCDNGGSAALPNWRLNLRFAAAWEAAMEGAYPGLTRPVLCGYRFYNQDLTTGSLLIEIGGHANTLDEALRAGRYAAEGLVKAVG